MREGSEPLLNEHKRFQRFQCVQSWDGPPDHDDNNDKRLAVQAAEHDNDDDFASRRRHTAGFELNDSAEAIFL